MTAASRSAGPVRSACHPAGAHVDPGPSRGRRPARPGARTRGLSEAHFRILKILVRDPQWIDIDSLSRRAGISRPEVARVYLSHIRTNLGDRIRLSRERGADGKSRYYLAHLDEGILPRCAHCGEFL